MYSNDLVGFGKPNNNVTPMVWIIALIELDHSITINLRSYYWSSLPWTTQEVAWNQFLTTRFQLKPSMNYEHP
jgi:hypothetical protein